jgi:hypothetical protein
MECDAGWSRCASRVSSAVGDERLRHAKRTSARIKASLRPLPSAVPARSFGLPCDPSAPGVLFPCVAEEH